MPLLKILLADDEKEARELLLHYLHRWQHTVSIQEALDGKTALKALKEFQPDILFLDIKMPELSGIEVLQNKEAGALPAVVFTTAYDEFALPAFDFEAVDYLLKPFDKERFEKALKRAMDYVEFIKNKKPKNFIANVAVRTGSKTDLIPVNDVCYFQAEGAYVQVVTTTKTYLVTDPIYELESSLDPKVFYRVHRSVIVNTQYIKSIQSLLNGDHILVLKNDKEIRASRTYREQIKKLKEG